MIPGFLVTLITFPGVIVHELAHAIFCRIYGMEIYEVKYFQLKIGRRQPAGYVLHKPSAKTSQNVMVAIGPFFINTIMGALIAAPAAIPVLRFGAGDPLDYFLIWLGVSIAMHAFPSTGDAGVIWSALKRPATNKIEKFFGYPIIGLIYLGSLGSMFWLDAIYGIAVAGLLPTLLIKLFV